jgi:hypothetical protein
MNRWATKPVARHPRHLVGRGEIVELVSPCSISIVAVRPSGRRCPREIEMRKVRAFRWNAVRLFRGRVRDGQTRVLRLRGRRIPATLPPAYESGFCTVVAGSVSMHLPSAGVVPGGWTEVPK